MKRLLPAYPIWLIDPNFSVWSRRERVNETVPTFWTGLERPAYGFVRYNGVTYSFLGDSDDAVALCQDSISVSAFSTDCTFSSDEFTLKVRFISPLVPSNLDMLSCPVCYTDYELTPKGELPSDFSISLSLEENFAYNSERAAVTGAVLPYGKFEAAYLTRVRNLYLSNTDDLAAPDYGDVFVTGEEAFYVGESQMKDFLASGKMQYGIYAHERSFIIGINRTVKGSFMVAYDDKVSIFYFGEWLRCYYFKDGKTISDALMWSYDSHDEIVAECDAFDKKLRSDCECVGKDYYKLAVAALRQSIAAHKLVMDSKGELLFLSKENNSCGCIGTADVSYPSMPLFLLYNPELVSGMAKGIFDFARFPVWTYDFAPHDIGVYPYCGGQCYSLNTVEDKYVCQIREFSGTRTLQNYYSRPAASNTYSIKRQMPVEECGNMLIMTAAAITAGANISIAKRNFDLLSMWVKYLEKYGLKPENQLCTDDFAGHLANNINLAIKALVGIESYSVIAKRLGKNRLSEKYEEKARVFAEKLKSMVGDGVIPLAYGNEGSFSLKYNILFDKLFGFDLVGSEICERECSYYIEKRNKFGTPLDTRESYTKSDWILWCAALTDKPEKTEAIYEPVIRFLEESPSRIPFGDWYYTDNGNFRYFINRSVQGGIFAPLLKASHKMKLDR